MSKLKCERCEEMVVPKTLREPALYVHGMQVGGKYYNACPLCLRDIVTGEDRQELDVTKAMDRMAANELKADFYEFKESIMALLYIIGFCVALVLLWVAVDILIEWGENFWTWLKGTTWYYRFYMFWIK